MTVIHQQPRIKSFQPPIIGAKPLMQPAEMVAAIIDGRKTQFRVPFNEQPGSNICILNHLSRHHIAKFAPLSVGNTVWIRETWAWTPPSHDGKSQLLYKATEDTWKDNPWVKWQSPATMPQEYCRLFGLITDVRAQRIQEITAIDALAEGIPTPNTSPDVALSRMQTLWNRHNAPQHEWDVNPWVWAYTITPELVCAITGTRLELEAHLAKTN